MAVISPGGVTSKAGLYPGVPAGATGTPARLVTSSGGRCSTLMADPSGVARSTVETGATTTNGTPWCLASTARPYVPTLFATLPSAAMRSAPVRMRST